MITSTGIIEDGEVGAPIAAITSFTNYGPKRPDAEITPPIQQTLPGMPPRPRHGHVLWESDFSIGGEQGMMIVYTNRGNLVDVTARFIDPTDSNPAMKSYNDWLRAFCLVLTRAVQAGVNPTDLATELAEIPFPPNGETGNKKVRHASSLAHYVTLKVVDTLNRLA